MAGFKNQRRFTLRCLDSNIIPVSLRLKSNIRTPGAINIIKKTERALLNERIRTINSTIEMLECQCHACRNVLNKVLDRETMAECDKIMVKIKEDRYHKTLERQKAKLDRLMRKEEPVNKGGCSNPNMPRYMYHNGNNRYMYQSGTDNLSRTSSTTPDNGTTSEDPTTNSRSTTTTTAVKIKFKMGHTHVKETTDRVTSEGFSPWAKLCSYPKKSTHWRVHCSCRENMSEFVPGRG